MTRRAAAISTVVALGLVALIVVMLVRPRGAASTAGAGAGERAASGPAVSLAVARFGTLIPQIRAQGRVGVPAGGDAKLAFAGSGIVSRVDVHVGETVTAGQALAELDTGGLAIDAAQARSDAAAAAAQYGGGSVPEVALTSARRKLAVARNRLAALESGSGTAQSDATGAQSALRQAQAKVDADQRSLQREQTLFAGGVAAQKDVEAARQQLALDQADLVAAQARVGSARSGIGSAVEQARADVAQAESDVRTAEAQTTVTGAQASSAQSRYAAAERNLANAVLRAPDDGVVVQILKHPGESVDPTQPAIVVGPPTSNTVTVTVAADAARDVRSGASAVIVDTGRNLRSQGTVRAVVPSVDPTTQTTTVVLGGLPPGAASGDAVNVTIDGPARRGVIIPADAVVEDPETGRAIVFVRARQKNGDEGFTSREVVTGATEGGSTIVTDGLRAGERIASRGAFDLLAPSGGG